MNAHSRAVRLPVPLQVKTRSEQTFGHQWNLPLGAASADPRKQRWIQTGSTTVRLARRNAPCTQRGKQRSAKKNIHTPTTKRTQAFFPFVYTHNDSIALIWIRVKGQSQESAYLKKKPTRSSPMRALGALQKLSRRGTRIRHPMYWRSLFPAMRIAKGANDIIINGVIPQGIMS